MIGSVARGDGPAGEARPGVGRSDEGRSADPYPRPRPSSGPRGTVEGMEILTVLGAGLGIAVLVVMALTPLLAALPERARRGPRAGGAA
jgi:hypothetical protein